MEKFQSLANVVRKLEKDDQKKQKGVELGQTIIHQQQPNDLPKNSVFILVITARSFLKFNTCF